MVFWGSLSTRLGAKAQQPPSGWYTSSINALLFSPLGSIKTSSKLRAKVTYPWDSETSRPKRTRKERLQIYEQKCCQDSDVCMAKLFQVPGTICFHSKFVCNQKSHDKRVVTWAAKYVMWTEPPTSPVTSWKTLGLWKAQSSTRSTASRRDKGRNWRVFGRWKDAYKYCYWKNVEEILPPSPYLI